MMTKEELERRCAEMRARYAASRSGAPPTTILVKSRAATKRLLPHPVAPVASESDFKLERPHPLVRASQTGLRNVHVEYDSLLAIAGPGRLDLKVSRIALPRALWIMDRFIKQFQAEGLQVESNDRFTSVIVEGQAIPIRIRESVTRVENEKPMGAEVYSWNRYAYIPTGVLTFHVLNEWGSARKYSDSVRSRLEDKFESVLNGIRGECARIRRREEEQRAREIIQRFEVRAEAARERDRLDIRARTESLLADVENWHASQRIRAYLGEFRATFEKWSGPIDSKSEVGKWLRWANQYADSLDPLCPNR